MTSSQARFITFEGGEGAGKSTQIRLLAEWLGSNGLDYIITREPGGCPGAEMIRDLLVKGETDRWTSMTEALLMTAARTEHVDRTIRPALESGRWVLCDRFYDSTIAYQGGARGLGMERMKQLQQVALGDVRPDLTLVLDLPVEVGLGRATGRESEKDDREDRFERMALKFHEDIRTAFRNIAEAESDRCVLVDANKGVKNLQAELRDIVAKRCGLPS